MKHILFKIDKSDELNTKLKEIESVLSEHSYKEVLFHLYSGLLDKKLLTDICLLLRGSFRDAVIAGSLSAGEILHGELMDDGVLISAMLFECTDILLNIYDDVAQNEEKTGEEICRLIDGLSDVKGVELLLPGTAFRTSALLDKLSHCKEGVQFFGGYSGGHSLDCDEHFVFNEDRCYDNAIFVITYSGKDFYIDTDRSVGWQTLGMPFKVTKAQDNRLIEINSRPAVEIYEKYLSIGLDDDFAENTFEFPLIAQVDNDELLRHTISVDDDGALVLAGYVKEGMNILLSYGNPTEIVKKVNRRLEKIRSFSPEAVLLYSCSVRKSFWESFVNIEMRPFEKLAPTAGFHTWGEVSRNSITGDVLEYNITLLSIAMREGEPRPPVSEKVTVDDSVLKGQASLIKRLSQLVSATTIELQKAFNVMSEMNERLLDMSIRDALTGLYNRGKTELLINEELDAAHSKGIPLSLVMLDIDFFKKVNDTYGHSVGDDVLKAVALMLDSAVSSHKKGYAGRWGGEEFFAVLPDTDEDSAMVFAETLRKHIEDFEFPVVKHLTISAGVITTLGGNHNEVYTKVDDALYRSKENGRNCVTKAQ